MAEVVVGNGEQVWSVVALVDYSDTERAYLISIPETEPG